MEFDEVLVKILKRGAGKQVYAAARRGDQEGQYDYIHAIQDRGRLSQHCIYASGMRWFIGAETLYSMFSTDNAEKLADGLEMLIGFFEIMVHFQEELPQCIARRSRRLS